MAKILFLTTMYPNSLRPGTPVCHYFTRQWVFMGHDVLVIHYRSMFPVIFTIAARVFPKLASKCVGNHVEMDRNMNVVNTTIEGIPVYSVPIFKYIPHGRYPKREIRKQVSFLLALLQKVGFTPDAIVGHFHNPQLEIVGALKCVFPKAHTCVSLHELSASVLTKCYGADCKRILDGIDLIGFRSVPIKQRFESQFGSHRRSFVCWSGTSQEYLNTPISSIRHFDDGPMSRFIYVGQTIRRKFPVQTIEALYKVYGKEGFHLTYVGSKDIAYPDTQTFIEENGLREVVTFAGKIPRDEIINQYDSNHCFILISKDEVFGLVYLEAMARGCITIAAKGEGMEGIIQDGYNGFLCEAGNPNELAAIIRHINALSASEKQAISDKARETAMELSDYNVAKHYIETVLSE
jgi:glycosyltransferase involved in cell wall biosynthesis